MNSKPRVTTPKGCSKPSLPSIELLSTLPSRSPSLYGTGAPPFAQSLPFSTVPRSSSSEPRTSFAETLSWSVTQTARRQSGMKPSARTGKRKASPPQTGSQFFSMTRLLAVSEAPRASFTKGSLLPDESATIKPPALSNETTRRPSPGGRSKASGMKLRPRWIRPYLSSRRPEMALCGTSPRGSLSGRACSPGWLQSVPSTGPTSSSSLPSVSSRAISLSLTQTSRR